MKTSFKELAKDGVAIGVGNPVYKLDDIQEENVNATLEEGTLTEFTHEDGNTSYSIPMVEEGITYFVPLRSRASHTKGKYNIAVFVASRTEDKWNVKEGNKKLFAY